MEDLIIKETECVLIEEKVEIKSIEQMSQYLEELQYNASNSVSSALNAQLQVIRYVSSPDLVNSTFDLLFKNLQVAIRDASDEDEKYKIRELSQLMIHNYIFFANAKLEYSLSRNKKAGEEVLKDATRELLNSAVNVIKLGESNKNKGTLNQHGLTYQGNHVPKKSTNSSLSLAGSGSTASLAPVVTAMAAVYVAAVAADFIKKITEKGGIWDRTMDWTFAALKNKREKRNFIEIIENIITKLDKYYHIIGKSNLMSDVIDRYTESIIKLKTQHLKNEARLRSLSYKPLLFIVTFLTAGGLFLIQLLHQGYNGIKNIVSTNTVAESNYIYHWLLLFAVFTLSYLWILLPKFQLQSKIRESENKYKMLSQKFLED